MYINGYATKQARTPMLNTLDPRAKMPPSAKKIACTVKITHIERNATYGPSNIESNRVPIICPLEPVCGIAKLIICRAKTKHVSAIV